MGKRKRHASNKDQSHVDGGDVGGTESRSNQQEGQRNTADAPAEGPPQQRRRRQQRQPQAAQEQQEQHDQQTQQPQQPQRRPQEQEQQPREGCEGTAGTTHDTSASSSKERRNLNDIAPMIHQQDQEQCVAIAGGSRDTNTAIHYRDNASNDLSQPLQNSARAPRVSSKSFRGRSSTKGARGTTVEGAVQGRTGSEPDTWLQRVRQQVEFYFSDANLRQDKFLKRKIAEDSGFVALSTIIQFNRVQSLKCRYLSQLTQAIRKSDMLILNEDKTKVKRDFDKYPEVIADALSRSVYVEGLPLTFGIDNLACFFAQYGHVRLVQLPRHRMTREPRGYCFVEYADTRQAATAIAELDGTWPSGWPVRTDGRCLRLMPKRKWLACRDEYKQLCHAARRSAPVSNVSKGEIGQERLSDPVTNHRGEDVGNTDTSAVPSVSATSLAPPLVKSDSLTQASGRPSPAHVSSSSRAKAGCIIEITNFPPPQTMTSIRQFAEHAVIVEYCDFNQPDGSIAHLRLKCPEDCQLLLEDLRKTGRMLGWVRPTVRVLGVEEEATYWQRVDERQAARSAADQHRKETNEDLLALPKKKRRSLLRPILQNPHGAVSGGPGTTSSLSRWPADGSTGHRQKESTGKQTVRSCSFVDTVGGNRGFVAAGFGRKRWLPRRGAGGRTRSASEDLLNVSATAAPAAAAALAVAPAAPAAVAAATSGAHHANKQESVPPGTSDAKDVGEGTGVPPIAIVPPSPMLQPSGAKAKRKPSRPNQLAPRSSLRSPPPTPVARPLGSMTVPPSPRRSEATRARREPSGKNAETNLPPPSPVAVRIIPVVNSAAVEGDAGATGTTVDAGMDSMLEDTDDILNAMGP